MKIFVDGAPGVSNSTLCRKTDEQRLGLGSSTNTQFYCHCNRQASGEPHLLKTSFVLMQIWNKKLCSTSSREPPIFQLWTAKPRRKNTLPSHSGNSSREPVTKLLHVRHFTSTCHWISSASAQHISSGYDYGFYKIYRPKGRQTYYCKFSRKDLVWHHSATSLSTVQ